MPTEYTHLYYYSADGNSDKEYIVFKEELENGNYHVYAMYGRRGHATNRAVKATNTEEFYADRVYRRLIGEKTSKGYRIFSAPKLPTRAVPSNNADQVVYGKATKATPSRRKITI